MFKISEEQLIQLSRIYNTLLTIETRGDNTIAMGDCLRAFQQSVQEIQKQPLEVATPEAEG